MSLKVLLDDVTVNTDGSAVQVQNFRHKEYGIVQCSIAGSATVKVQGRTSVDMGWVDAHEFTSDGAVRVSLFTEMRGKATGVSGGAVRLELIE